MAKSSYSPFSPASPRPRLLVQRAEYIDPPEQFALANLWQMPVLLLSLGLFTLAAWLLIEPQPPPAFQRQLALARQDVDTERFDAAIGRLNDLITTRPEPADEVSARLLLAEAMDLRLRRSRRYESPQASRRIIQEIQQAYRLGFVPTADTSDRLARSHDALGDIDEAAANFQRAVELLEQSGKPERALPMRRSAIDMLVAYGRQVPASQAIEQFLGVAALGDDERAWAMCELAGIHIDAGRHADARTLLAAAAALSPDELIQGQVSYRLGYAAWMLGERSQAREHLLVARRQLGPGHPLDAEACYLLGRLAQDDERLADAIGFFDLVIRDYPDSRAAPRAQVSRGMARLLAGEVDQCAADLIGLADDMARKPALRPVRSELLGALQRAGRILASQHRYEPALELLKREKALDPQAAADFLSRRSQYLDALAAQVEVDLTASSDAAKPSLELRLRAVRSQAAAAHVDFALHLAEAGDSGYGALLWKAIDLFEQAEDSLGAISALERFCSDRPRDPVVPDALLRLGRMQETGGEQDEAKVTLNRVRQDHGGTTQAIEAALLLAQMEVADEAWPAAEVLLREVLAATSVPGATKDQALWQLAQLCHRTGRFEESLTLLDARGGGEIRHSVSDNGRAQRAYLVGDCHRQLAQQRMAEVGPRAAQARPGEPQLAAAAEDSRARRHLEAAAAAFEQAMRRYRETPPRSALDEAWLRLAHFGRADCLFDLGRYQDAIKLYGEAAGRYTDDLSVLAATVQIANANAALGREPESRRAAEEAMRLLQRVRRDGFTLEALVLPRRYWQEWLDRAQEAGLW